MKNDGGPAFPTTNEVGSRGEYRVEYRDGMTLRDWFVGQALAGGVCHPGDAACVAADAYRIADAMLAVRER